MAIKFFRFLVPALAAVSMMTACDGSKEEWKPGDNTGGGGDKPVAKTVWHERAAQTYDAICTFYEHRSGTTAGLFNENYPKGSGDGLVSFLWPYDGMVSGFAAMNKLGYDVKYIDRVERFQAYYRNSGAKAIGGYGSSTDGQNGGGDRFYDDNSIIGIELVEAYNQTHDSKYLDRCAQIVRFLQGGYDSTMGNALWWCESNINQKGNDSSNKPACANGYATWFLMSYYEVCPESEKAGVLDFAKSLYSWLYSNLRDPEDNTYWNSKGADGNINRTKWTYNSGAMIAAGVRLYKATGEKSYLDQAQATALGSYNYFVRSRNGLVLAYPTNDPWFTIQLIKAYIELEPYYTNCKGYIETFISFADYAWKNGRNSNGLFYEDWTGKNVNPDRDKQLLMQAAGLESLAVIALYKGEHK